MIYLLIATLTFSIFVNAVPFEGQRILIAGPNQVATEVGAQIAKRGGNVADVTVATAFALSVTSPYYASLGGGGFAVVRLNNEDHVIDFRETAPQKTHKDFYLNLPDTASRRGGSAVAVPGVVKGLFELHKKYGSLKWRDLLAPSVRLAQQGFQVSGEWVRHTDRAKAFFSPAGLIHFSGNKGQSLLPGDVLKQPALAKALQLIASQGASVFYEGSIGKDIAETVLNQKGVLTLDDLKNYKVIWRKPLKANFAGHELILMPPPSSGGALIAHNLALFEQLKVKEKAALSVDELHLIGEIMSRSFRNRVLFADPKFNDNPVDRLMTEEKIKATAGTISLKTSKALKPLANESGKESTETTHFSVLDIEGNAVAFTVTLNGTYGSGVVSKDYGIALNNEMDDFTTDPKKPNMFGLMQGEANLVEPGKRPLSSMSPTVVVKDGKAIMSLGSPGGPRIINAVTQVLIRTLINNWDIDKAIQSPRVHHQFLPHQLVVDKDRLSPDVLSLLRKRGHEINESWVAKVYGVRLNSSGLLEAAFDNRGEGGASGF